MTGEAFSPECFTGVHIGCAGSMAGYQGALVACTCSCHVPARIPRAKRPRVHKKGGGRK